MSARTHRPGTVLHCEDGAAVVVERGTTPIEGLITLLEEGYGERFAADNPAFIAALPSVRVETWMSCSKSWREEHCDDPYTDDWWSADGDGKRFIDVAHYDGNMFMLGDDAREAAERGEMAESLSASVPR